MNKLKGVANFRAREVVHLVRSRLAGKPVETYISTGFSNLDRLCGLERGIVTTIGAHSGEGKSTFGMYLARAAAKRGGVLWFSMEDPLAKTCDRLFALETGLSAFDLGRGQTGVGTEQRLKAADLKWTENVLIDDNHQTPGGILADIEEHQEVNGVRVETILIDYAQVLPSDERGGLESVIRKLVMDLSQIAKERNICVVVFSQLKREAMDRGMNYFMTGKANTDDDRIKGYRPSTMDLAWSSALLQFSKAVWLLFRPGRWKLKHKLEAEDNVFEVIVAKANFGKEGTVYLKCDMETMHLYESAAHEEKLSYVSAG